MPRSVTSTPEPSGRRTGIRRPSAVTAMATRSLFVFVWPNGDSNLRLSRECTRAPRSCPHVVLVQYLRYTSIPSERRYSAGVR
jgi:hypothetical protein